MKDKDFFMVMFFILVLFAGHITLIYQFDKHLEYHECQDVQRWGSLIECKEGE